VFTHFSDLEYGGGLAALQNKYGQKYKEIFKSYLLCPEIALVYVYVDWSFKQVTPLIAQPFEAKSDNLPPAEPATTKFTFDPSFHVAERQLKDFLKVTAGQARSTVRREHPSLSAESPEFIYVGLSELVGLLDSLIKVNPEFTQYFCGHGGKFTYDSPKFVEAVIRLARGDTPHLAGYPVVRIDEDAVPNPLVIRELLGHYEELCQSERFYIFSGAYGDPATKTRVESEELTGEVDYLNDFAVRTHFFAEVGTRDGRGLPSMEQIKHFLGDLDALGAKQLHPSREHYTQRLTELISLPGDHRDPSHPENRGERPSTQVVSGAGLIMAVGAVRFLPPFMNFQHLTVWVDDHLKRRLHEGLGDLSRDDLESVPSATIRHNRYEADDKKDASSARIRQDRYPEGVKAEDVEKAIRSYFDRLLRGCVFRRTIVNNDGTATAYTELLAEIVKLKVLPESGEWPAEKDPGLRSRSPGVIPPQLGEIRDQMISDAEERYDEVLKCWSSDELQGSLLWRWTRNRMLDPLDSPLLHAEDQLVPLLVAKRLCFPRTPAERWLREKCRPELGRDTLGSLNDYKNILELCKLRADELLALTKRLNKIIKHETLWQESDFSKAFEDTRIKPPKLPGDNAKTNRELLQWAFPEDIPWWNHRERICQAVVDDGLSYARLVYYWPVFVRAIERLPILGNSWLFTPIDVAPR